jgi:hypothetical protein
MSSISLKLDTAARPESSESAAERETRIRREAETIACAHAAIDAGFGIEDEAMEAWLASLDSDPYAPLPQSHSLRSRR